MKEVLISLTAVIITLAGNAQCPDSNRADYSTGSSFRNTESERVISLNKNRPPGASFIMPGILVAYGFVSLKCVALENINRQFKNELWLKRPHSKVTVDDYLQFTPAAMVYVLNGINIKGQNNFTNRSLVYVLSNIIMTSAVVPLKHITHQLRPDSSNYQSFPSGHTAEAFLSAEFLRQEYKNCSNWYGVAGYAIAVTTGLLRIYNNDHSFADVITGAGIGIASTRLAYWLTPVIKDKFFKHKTANTLIIPAVGVNKLQLNVVHFF